MELPPEKPETLTRETGDDVALLIEFLRDRDAPCPLCGYNLRALTRPECPECHEELSLTVGVRRVRLAWFLATITPGIFSGIAAGLLLIPMALVPLTGAGPPPWHIIGVDVFGWLSGIAALVLFKHRFAFLRLPQAAQRTWAATAWAIHLGAFAVLIATLFLF